MELLKLKDLKINEVGYLVAGKSEKPVNHEAFVAEQKAAHYLVSIAEAIKDKNFKQSEVANYDAIVNDVYAKLQAVETIKYVNVPTKPTMKITETLADEALEFLAHGTNVEKTNSINRIVNQFNTINGIETVGDYFEEKLVKLTKIYTIKDIIAAATIQVEKLN